jgi:hypothetical protein
MKVLLNPTVIRNGRFYAATACGSIFAATSIVNLTEKAAALRRKGYVVPLSVWRQVGQGPDSYGQVICSDNGGGNVSHHNLP